MIAEGGEGCPLGVNLQRWINPFLSVLYIPIYE